MYQGNGRVTSDKDINKKRPVMGLFFFVQELYKI